MRHSDPGSEVAETRAKAAGLLVAVAALAAPGSRLLLEQGRDVTATPHDPSLAHLTDLWRGGLGPGTREWLDGHGWTTGLTTLDQLAQRYARPLPGPSAGGLIEAVRRPVA
ncbi:hypothetical protein GCM10009639_50380 [Kitasatospora putterlickiae]|uniref:Uncharacterized protein n=1 Tax=Kitasatospora putterlickiae TaxID=221725 RepID=A0ABP4J523_9ACTN